MRILTSLPLKAAPIAGRIPFPGHSMTVVIKGLFRLEEERISELLEDHDLAYPTGDVPAVEDDDEHSEIRYANDFVHYKPRTDLMLVGQCHAPGGRPVASSRVTFQVGDHGRTLQVYGDRWWAGGTMGAEMTDPQPFTQKELTWDRAYGGPRCPDNPVGRGNESVELEDGQRAWPLPNIEFPEQRIGAPEDRPAPAGFGPQPLGWEPRRSRTGTYDEEWLQTRWPWYAEDMDWGLFNAASPILQPEGFLRGDEEVYLENLRPGKPHFQTRLPGLRVRCFVHQLPEGADPPPPTEKGRQDWSPPPRENMEFQEVGLNLDTLWVDAEEGLVALVWRGYTPVLNEEFADVQEIFVTAESLDDAPASPETYRAQLWALLDELEGTGEEELEEEESGAGEGEGPEAPEEPGFQEVTESGEVEEEEDELDIPSNGIDKLMADLDAMGLDPENPPEISEEDRERAANYLREQGMDDLADFILMTEDDWAEEEPEDEASDPGPWTRERVVAKHQEDGDLAEEDLSGLDLSGLDLAAIDLSGADLTDVNLAGAVLADATLTGATLSGLDGTDADFTGALLGQCDFAGARLSKAVFAGADLTGARMAGVPLIQADLTGALMESAILGEADLTGIQAEDAVFVEADLTGAVLIRGLFKGADFTGAALDRVDAREASFESAEFPQATAVEAMLAGADLTGLRAADALDFSGANLSQVKASGSVWSGATLVGTVMAWADLDGADFTGADLERADFYAAHLREARFSKAHLLDARLAAADAFEAKFDKADLARADLRGGNFYGAEFMEARFWETATDGANLTMTKYG